MIVLDTHALLWMDRNDPTLGPQTRALIENTWRSDVVAVSVISFWETALLAERGRIVLPAPPEAWRLELLQAGLREIAVDGRVSLLSRSFARQPSPSHEWWNCRIATASTAKAYPKELQNRKHNATVLV